MWGQSAAVIAVYILYSAVIQELRNIKDEVKDPNLMIPMQELAQKTIVSDPS